ncbi:MAG: hypothetical protein OXC46_06850, partial [Thaumarchaeota archaeon]|nr:hypothetical protein [Nitrososphaerota archaeon]
MQQNHNLYYDVPQQGYYRFQIRFAVKYDYLVGICTADMITILPCRKSHMIVMIDDLKKNDYCVGKMGCLVNFIKETRLIRTLIATAL